MASLSFSISLDTYEFKKLNFIVNSSQLADRCSISQSSGCVRATGSSTVIPLFSRLKHVRVSRLGTEISGITDTSEADECDIDLDKHLVGGHLVSNNHKFYEDSQKGRVNIWKRFRGGKQVSKTAKTKQIYRRNGVKYERERGSAVEIKQDCSASNSESFVEFDPTVFEDNLSLERCNSILKQLERDSHTKALRFFDWMKSNGKLKQNVTAYCLALRVFGRREDWNGAQKMIQEMTSISGCQLNAQVFNTLIYACNKQGLDEMGAKWFHMMLEYGVQPNVATFGMLMSLYQKKSVVDKAEFTFSQMRNLKIKCQSAYSAMITIHTRLGLYAKVEEVIGFLREDEIILNLENWLVLLNAYSQQGKLQEAERVLFLMQKAGFSQNIVAYNMLITGYGKASNMDAAHLLFTDLKKVGVEPDESTYRSMIEGWGRVGNYKEAAHFYMELKRLGFKPASSNIYTMINLQARHEDEEGAIRTINDMVAIGCQYSSILGLLLQAYERAERFDKVPSVIRSHLYGHVLSNHTSCSILVVAYTKHGLVDEAIQVLKDKRWEDPIFEDNLYHLLICSCKDLGHLEDAIKIYTHMPKPEKPNLHIACTMIDIYSAMNLFNEAENVYFNLKSSETALDMITFSVVIRMYAKSGSLKNACSVIETVEQESNIVPDVYLLRDMLRVYQKCGMVDKLADLYYKISKSGMNWDQEMYNCVINCCARALPVDEISWLFDEMLRRGFEPNTITFNVMLYVYGKSRLFKKARMVFGMARKRGLLDVISYNTIIAAYGQSKDFKNMTANVKKMQFNGFSVSLEAYNCMLDAYGKEGEMEKFRSVLQRMRESNCTSDNYTYNIMINIYGERGWIEEVSEVLLELKESGIRPDLCSYNTVIKAYGIAGMIEDSVAVVKEMRENGIEPDRITYINLINALHKNDKFLEAVKWSLWMKQMGL